MAPGCCQAVISAANIPDERVKSRSAEDFKGLIGLRLEGSLSLSFNLMPCLWRFSEICGDPWPRSVAAGHMPALHLLLPLGEGRGVAVETCSSGLSSDRRPD
ncbi:hypothetical protein AAFF_G00400740 [Aldrovandia affinis]|uniref:Uncharacterized protein n=1 Tax=Aldrovandia affinis TaxID=143900 RepID=A0AAD7WKH9_9TELE|nr:hypothetical protein AAFF_G00400740 [Aldrovandia affinis]